MLFLLVFPPNSLHSGYLIPVVFLSYSFLNPVLFLF